MKALIPYRDDDPVAQILESPGIEVDVDMLGPTSGVLTSFAAHLPLVPGDVLSLEGDQVVDVLVTQPLWVFEVLFNTPAADVYFDDDIEWAQAELAALDVITQLTRLAQTNRGTTFSVTLATESRGWFDAFMANCPNVASYQVLRRPGDGVDLEAELSTVVAMRPLYGRDGVLL